MASTAACGTGLVCKVRMHGLRYDGIYTPPSLGGSIVYPGNLGGVNWGSAAYDPATGLYYANNNRAAYLVKLVRQDTWFDSWNNDVEPALQDWRTWVFSGLGILLLNTIYRFILGGLSWKKYLADEIPAETATHLDICRVCCSDCGSGGGVATGAPACRTLGMSFLRSARRRTKSCVTLLEDSDGRPCAWRLPWGAMTAINLNTGKLVWAVRRWEPWFRELRLAS